MKISSTLILASTLVLATLAGCAAATDNTTSTPSATVSPRAYVLSWTGTSALWPNTSFGVKPLTGKTIKDVSVTYAVNAAVLAGTGNGAGWNAKNTGDTNDTWLGNVASGGFPTAADTWTTTSVTGAGYTVTATDNVSLKAWTNANGEGKLSVKQVVVTYSDNAVETLTFTSDGTAPVKAVLAGVTTTSTVAARFWSYIDNSLTLTPSYAALAN